ncbi:aminotransferase class I/II-fold pyridoxal phosphate-dependent enzyme [Virgibacillus doumboii]|uniref:aminotransferase class I/II-fold pyridoxal phosphate-dependent enzyme n=1 Tax=Virgibacillus doumboii TaxID=2697503 RepID=UPI0013DEFE7C|nr:aminotransferase class I/II-fold pyridoxal phosphate-dependent enzyme [Virgibacillus doumboii]
MQRNQQKTPLFDALKQFSKNNPISFHVPGHKNGDVFPANGREIYHSILPLDMTELSGLDDLHSPQGVIKEAQELAADFFGADYTHFLVGGSTAGNLAVILAVCSAGEKIIVQRNCHKSVFNGLELSGARPVFISPEFDGSVDRYTAPGINTLKETLQLHPDAKAVVLTYPDYFGKTFAIREMIELVHEYNVPVLVDEAHGVHFLLDKRFPQSALALGADAVVQSAHKMASAMTMGSYLHVRSGIISNDRLSHYLQMVQSSSPSYPIMASLDLSRSFLADLTRVDMDKIMSSVLQVRKIMQSNDLWDLLPADDPLKLTLHVKHGITGNELAHLMELEGVYPELASHNQVLLIHGLAPFEKMNHLQKAVTRVKEQLKNKPNHATIEIKKLFTDRIQELAKSYQEMQQQKTKQIPLNQSSGYVAAEAIIPYPPGIPYILKGERITNTHISIIEQLMKQGAVIQHRNLTNGISVFDKGDQPT